MSKTLQRRTFDFDVRQDTSGDFKLSGHAAVFNQPVELWKDYIEQIAPGAFKKSLKSRNDVRALFNHNPDYVLGRTTNDTLKLSEDSVGLFTEIDPPETQWAKDLMISIERGDISQMSFAFYITDKREKTVDGKRIVTITDVELFDVSPVTFPAYTGTDIALRSLSNGMQYKVPRPGGKGTASARARNRERGLALRAKIVRQLDKEHREDMLTIRERQCRRDARALQRPVRPRAKPARTVDLSTRWNRSMARKLALMRKVGKYEAGLHWW